MINPYNFLPGNPNNLRVSGVQTPAPNVNSMGYRAPEFDTVDWKNSIVLLGCSFVYGTSINNEDTISTNLEKITGRPVINMGVPGSSIVYSFVNQLKLYEHGIHPYAVVNCWTTTHRLTYFIESNMAAHLGPWVDEDLTPGLSLRLYKKMFSLWNFKESNSEAYSSLFQQMARIIWKDKRYLEYSFFPATAEQFNIKLLEQSDFGSDNAHPGVQTTLDAAKIIAQDLKSK